MATGGVAIIAVFGCCGYPSNEQLPAGFAGVRRSVSGGSCSPNVRLTTDSVGRPVADLVCERHRETGLPSGPVTRAEGGVADFPCGGGDFTGIVRTDRCVTAGAPLTGDMKPLPVLSDTSRSVARIRLDAVCAVAKGASAQRIPIVVESAPASSADGSGAPARCAGISDGVEVAGLPDGPRADRRMPLLPGASPCCNVRFTAGPAVCVRHAAGHGRNAEMLCASVQLILLKQ
ncbi:hypothetical protein NONO_c06480 [Nocardia nova SH22a]|uniref:Uncharacterized protein n=1 Tax=Nocardia nova SH22a TaxID=1415166 RepID=W5T819_9NOCA|nr:hypothetical protein NONO_c06480 [Nocardia nova SH22a]